MKVPWTYAKRIIAGMKHEKTKWDLAVGHFPYETMGFHCLTANNKAAISLTIGAPCP